MRHTPQRDLFPRGHILGPSLYSCVFYDDSLESSPLRSYLFFQHEYGIKHCHKQGIVFFLTTMKEFLTDLFRRLLLDNYHDFKLL